MSLINIFFAGILFVMSTVLCLAQRVDERNPSYPIPLVKLKSFKDVFDLDFLIKKNFQANQFIAVAIELSKPKIDHDENSNILSLSRDSVEVAFLIKETAPLQISKHPGQFINLLTWPPGFKLEPGSRIVFRIKYIYSLKDRVVEHGEIVEEIRF